MLRFAPDARRGASVTRVIPYSLKYGISYLYGHENRPASNWAALPLPCARVAARALGSLTSIRDGALTCIRHPAYCSLHNSTWYGIMVQVILFII